jgi:hypothetical protein
MYSENQELDEGVLSELGNAFEVLPKLQRVGGERVLDFLGHCARRTSTGARMMQGLPTRVSI